MPWKEEVKTPTTTAVMLDRGQYTAIPGSATVVLLGPGIVDITRHPNGQVSGQIREGSTGSLFDAVNAQLERVGW